MARVSVSGAALHELVRLVTARPFNQSPGEPACVDIDVLTCLKRLIPSDTVVYNDYATRHWSDSVYADTEPAEVESAHDADEADDLDRVFVHHYWTGACSRHDRVGDFETVIILTDLMSLRAWRTCPLVVDMQNVIGDKLFDRDLMIPLPGGPGHSRRVRFERDSGRDFDDTDRAVATLVRPLLVDYIHALDGASHGIVTLTTRQRQLLSFVADGYTNAQVARTLGITAATVRTHLQQIYTRLGVSSRGEAAALVRGSDPVLVPERVRAAG